MILECIPDFRNAEKWAAFAASYGLCFEYNEFYNPLLLDDKIKLDEVIRIYENLGRDTSNDTMHGAFLDITVSSSDPMIKNASDYRIRQSLDIACRLNLRGIVFHTNYLTDFKSKPYRNQWVESNTIYWDNLCSEYKNVNIYLENMFDDTPELLSRVAKNLTFTKNFGVCLDIAHAFLSKIPLSEWIQSLEGHIKHIHINDNDGEEDLHLSIGSGKMDWSVLKDPGLFTLNPSVLIEVTGEDKTISSYNYLKGLNFLKETESENNL